MTQQQEVVGGLSTEGVVETQTISARFRSVAPLVPAHWNCPLETKGVQERVQAHRTYHQRVCSRKLWDGAEQLSPGFTTTVSLEVASALFTVVAKATTTTLGV